MVDIKKFKLILGIFIPFFAIFLMSQNTFAASLSPTEFGLRWRDYNSATYTWTLQLYSGQNYYVSGFGLNGVRVQWQDLTYQGNHASIHSEINVVSWEAGTVQRNLWVNLPYQSVLGCSSSQGTPKIEQSNVNSVVTNWTGQDGSARSTLTLFVDIALSDLPQNSNGHIACIIGSDSYAFATNNYTTNSRYYVERAPSTIEFSNNINDVLLQTQINQNNSMIYNQNMMIDQNKQINTNIVEGFDQLHQDQQNASDNIEGQDSSDIEGAENQQTTNLIGIITNFINILRGYGDSYFDCNIILPFPEFLGGDTNVNICEGKNKLTYNGINYVTIFGGRFFMICFFVPIIWILLKMIYNEIRSWTNG